MKERLIMLANEAKKDKRKRKQVIDDPSVDDISLSDWVGLRLLSLLLSTDVSNSNIKDVSRSMKYYTEKYSDRVIQQAFCLLTRDRALNWEWDDPESSLIRGLNRNMQATDNGRVI